MSRYHFEPIRHYTHSSYCCLAQGQSREIQDVPSQATFYYLENTFKKYSYFNFRITHEGVPILELFLKHAPRLSGSQLFRLLHLYEDSIP